jgi:hypothetical protein
MGPWINSLKMNAFTLFIIAILVTLSLILTAAVLFPGMGSARIAVILGVGFAVAVLSAALYLVGARRPPASDPAQLQRDRLAWRAPSVDGLGEITLTPLRRFGMLALRGYLGVAALMVIVRVIQTASG